ncbi:MAG TPA: serine/threonine-protein kinase [Gemmatimonadaceae bacterium]|nr:serine/threonine-protein kinase [Gemmatimonadaceae bacterium]
MLGPASPSAPPRFSVSMLPVDADPAERDFVRLLERALAPSFTLVRRLGAGAMGSVYLARDPVLKRLVAVKVMAPALASDPQARARFEREAQTVASISHPNVVAVYSVGTLENGVPFLVMQYVEGKTMAERIAEGGPLDAPTAKRVLGEVASALAAAHRKGVIHRDIKPSNILWDDETGRALVTDFGIAAVKPHGDKAEAQKLTQTGMAIGTPAYMSPEQVLGEEVTEKTDVYSLGVLGYEMLIADGPYQLSKPGEAMAAHLRDEPRKLSKMRADVDPEVERLLEDCLTKDPERRPTAQEAEERIMHGASILLEWPPPGLEHLRDKFQRALRPTALGGALVGVPLVLLSVFDRGSYVRDLLPPIEFILAIAWLGFFVFLAGCLRLLMFFRAAGKAIDTGFHWGTIAETVADERGDTGSLITGGKEYATLTPARRSRLRTLRVVGAACLLLAAVTPILGFAAGVIAAARFEPGPTVVLWTGLIVPVLFATIWALLVSYENRTMLAARSRRLALSSVHERPTELAAAWTDTFNQVRLGQRMGPGPAGHRTRVWRTVVTATALAAFVALVGDLLIVIAAVSQMFGMTQLPYYGNTRAKVHRVQRLASYRVPADSSITPLRAGQALYAVARTGPGRSGMDWSRPPSIQLPSFNLPEESPPFGSKSGVVDAFGPAARRSLTDAQRRYLSTVSRNPALAEFRLAANAPHLDMGAALFEVPTGSRLSILELPIVSFSGIRTAATSNIAAAALDLAGGQREDAERRLREVLSVGFLLMNDGRSTLESLIGAAIVNVGREALQSFYEATGRVAEARAVSAESDPSFDMLGELDRRRVPPNEVYAALRRIILDTTELRGLRWEMLMNYSYAACSDPRQMIFGPDARHRAAIDSARASLVRNSSDSLVFAFAELPLDERRMTRDGVPLVRERLTVSGWIGSRLTGHNVFSTCAGILGLN